MATKKVINRMSEPWGYRDQDMYKKKSKSSSCGCSPCYQKEIEFEIERAMDKEFEIEDKLNHEIERSTNADKKHETELNNLTDLVTNVTRFVGAIDEKVEFVESSAFFSTDYDPSGKTINFYNKTHNLIGSIDATPFLIDGMVQNVEIKDVASSGTCLVVSFNTDAGKQDINIPISDIFDANNYYDKTAIDNKLGSGFTVSSVTEVIEENELIVSNSLIDLETRKADASAFTNTISGVTVNNVTVTPTNNIAPISIAQATNSPIIVQTDNNTGAITLGMTYIDCGEY